MQIVKIQSSRAEPTRQVDHAPLDDFEIRVLREHRGEPVRTIEISAVSFLVDVLVIIVGALCASLLRFGDPLRLDQFVLPITLAIAVVVLSGTALRSYSDEHLIRRGFAVQRWLLLWTLALALVFAGLFFTNTNTPISRLWIGYWFIVTAMIAVPVRYAWSTVIMRWQRAGRLGETVALAGAPDAVEGLLRSVADNIQADIAIFDRRIDDRGSIPPALLERLRDVDRLLLAFDPDDPNLRSWLNACRRRSMHADLVPSISRELLAYEPHMLSGLTAWRLATKPLTDEALLAKRLEDIVIGGALLVATLPLMGIIALLVRIDSPGPILFRQTRHGFNDRPFDVLKFRTMYHVPHSDDGRVAPAVRNDPRVTRVGAFLRATSFDELPQFFNVMRGEMSLVGPRPQALAHSDEYGRQLEDYFRRHRLKPGITGWAQVNGVRGETKTLDRMIEHDLYYVDNWSIGFDLRIMARTLIVVLRADAF
ncbi:MAG: exopolysaccharide biosynthesis polyprenyl glycosylphosphotransferase [Pseudomonadales bacterium]|nr:exopolysaccharide biosynthesis polyprenyl glycosylphosphotransferase [Pseudomonadales bacterium]